MSDRTMPRGCSRFAVAAWALLVAAATAGCKRKPGDACSVGQALCEDSATILACRGGVFVEARCRGPAGCARQASQFSCDDTIGEEGDACLQYDVENHACSADKKKHLVCERARFTVVEPCRGPNGCTISGENVTCDTRLAQKDDPCAHAGEFACSVDRKLRLVCKDGKMALDRFCRGPLGCRDFDRSCDESFSEVGDPCGTPGMVACTVDGSAELVCLSGQYVEQRKCRRAGCHLTPSRGVDCP